VVKDVVRALSFAAVLRVAAMLATLAFASSAQAHAAHHVTADAAGLASRHVAANAPSAAAASHRHVLSPAPACPGESSDACSCGVALGTAPQPLPACVTARQQVEPPRPVELTSIRRWPDVRRDTSLLVVATYASRAPPTLLP
jgi:hypothetical protein